MARYGEEVFLLLSILLSANLQLALSQENFVRSEILSDFYRVKWEVDFTSQSVNFEVVASTTGYVGFGLSPNGGMKGADIVIGGVHSNGTTYFDDRHATGTSLPLIDPVQNWYLVSATEDQSLKTTTLKFFRNFATCDDDDISITDDTTHLIFSIGETDSLVRHVERGTKAVNLLDPPNPPVNIDNFNTWNLTVQTTLPEQDTTYWCTIHKAPKFNKTAHIVGFAVMLESVEALKYTHHLVLHRCIQPAGSDVNLTEILEPWLSHPGEECYEDDTVATFFEYCNSYQYVWAKGGDPLLLPEHVGFPIGEDTTQNDYFILEIHYDNPDVDKNVILKSGLTVYHTYDLRKNDAGLLVVGHDPHPNMVIPPNTADFVIVGHCASECTTASFPPDGGINVFNVLLHSHLDGRKLKVRHFRDGEELPWISVDDNYDFDYQQNRPLRKEVKILQGDHLTYECTYDSTWMDPKVVTVGGISTRHEMCETFLLYYPLVQTVDLCGSSAPFEILTAKFGIENYTYPSSDPIITAPSELNGMSFTQVLNTKVNWTKEFVEEVQSLEREGDHYMICLNYKDLGNSFKYEGLVMTNYPSIREPYEPPQEVCKGSAGAVSSHITSAANITCMLLVLYILAMSN